MLYLYVLALFRSLYVIYLLFHSFFSQSAAITALNYSYYCIINILLVLCINNIIYYFISELILFISV